MSKGIEILFRIILLIYIIIIISYVILLIIQGFKNKEYNEFNTPKIVNILKSSLLFCEIN